MANKRCYLLLCCLFAVFFLAIMPTVHAAEDFTVDLPNTTIENPTEFNSKTIFRIPNGDISRIFLGQFFGTLGDSGLTGSGSIMPAIFEVFNTIALGLGSIVVMFTLVASVLAISNQGNDLGKKWSSMWLPLRTTIGVAVLLPIKGGYSLLQAMLMWAILQGIGMADYIWERGAQAALETPLDTSTAAIANKGLDEAGQLFHLLTCMEAVNKVNKSGNVRIVINPNLYGPPAEHNNHYVYRVGSIQTNNGVTNNACGEISWPIDKDPDINEARLTATRSLITNLATSASGLVNFGINYVNLAELANSATSYVDIIKQILSEETVDQSEQLNTLISRGWMLAGAFYYDMVLQNNQFQANFTLPAIKNHSEDIGIGSDQALVDRYLQEADTYISTAKTQIGIDAAAGQGITANFTSFNDQSSTGDSNSDASIEQGLSELKGEMQSTVSWWLSLFTESNNDPLLAIQSAGQNIVEGVEIAWITSSIIVALMGVASTCVLFNPTFNVLQNFLAWMIPLFSTMFVFLYVSGAVLAYYLPLIPLFLFSFGALGWMFGVIELIVAAPIIALGTIYAGGSEKMGKAAPAVLLLTDLVVRPGLMIIGLLAAIIMVRIAIHFINLGFAMTNRHIFAGGISYLTSVIALICIYTSIIVTVVKKCFKLIYLVPSRVMRWIGGQSEAFETGAAEENAMGEAFEKSIKQFGKLGGEAAGGKSTMKRGAQGFGIGEEKRKANTQGIQTSQTGGGG